MDKQEYKIRAEEIRVLVEERNYKEAADIADTIDWRRVKNIKMLCMISDVYKMIRRYDDSKTILEMAYEKRPGSRMIVFALAELCLKQGNVVQAWECYKEFCQIAPDDSRRHILLYKVYSAQEVSPEEQIKVLETLKEEEYIDRWVYELAYLYHKTGFGTKCVEECDEMILWLGEGRYVRKAMELKMQHEPLTPKQQALYDGVRQKEIETGETQIISDLDRAIIRENASKDVSKAPTIRLPLQEVEDDIQVKILDDSPYNTLNLQQALAKDMKLLMEDTAAEALFGKDEEEVVVKIEEPEPQEALEEEGGSETDDITKLIIAPMLEDTQEVLATPEAERIEEVFFEDPNTTDLSDAVRHADTEQSDSEKTEAPVMEISEETPEEIPPTYEEKSSVSGVKKVIVPTVPGILKAPKETMLPTYFAGQKSGFDEMLSQGADGQLSLVVPEKEKVEKQITGQMSIQDILQEWEQMKRDKETELKDNVQKSVLDRTGDIFAEFEASKDDLIKELEEAAKEVEKVEEEAVQTLSKEVEPEIKETYAEVNTPAEADTEESGEQEYLFEEEPEENIQTDADLPVEETLPEELRPIANDRPLSAEEKELFEKFVQSRKAKGQLLHMLDNMSLAAYTGNVLITGDEDAGTINFARNLVRDIQMSDRNFSGKAAKINGKALNKKNPGELIEQLKNGALIIAEAGGMNCSTVEALVKALQTENTGIIVMLVDTKGAINSLLDVNAVLADPFNTRIDIEALDDKTLVAYGKKFAYDREYGIDEMGILALHTRIADMQTAEHSVTTSDVRMLVKEAIRHAERKTPKHFFDVLLGKRYDKEDMIVLREEDFLYSE